MSSPPDELQSLQERVEEARSSANEVQEESRPEQPRLFSIIHGQKGAGDGEEEAVEEEPTEESSEGVPDTDPEAPLGNLLAFDGEPSPIYIGALLVSSGGLVVAASLDMFPWLATLVGIVALLATMFRGGRWLTLVGGVAIVAIVVVAVWPRQKTLADVRGSADAGSVTASNTSQEEAGPPGSLGVQLDDVTGLWNELDAPPVIRRGFVRNPESGQLDSFVYQFDPGASLAGAYDPTDDYVYALLASARLNHAAAPNMYLHLCYMLHPFSQECIDGYFNEGLSGEPLESYVDTRHEAEWVLEGHTWRLDISGNVQSLRVLGQGAR